VLSPATCKAVRYADVEAFEARELGIHEQMEGLHGDDDISAIIATVGTDAIRMPERKRMVEFRTQVTVEAIKKSMAK